MAAGGISSIAARSAEWKVFVGSIPNTTPEEVVKAEFEKYGHVANFHMKKDLSGPQRTWAFVTYQTKDAAQLAIGATSNGKLVLPGSSVPCEVTFARSSQPAAAATAVLPGATPAKIFVGSIPPGTSEGQLRTEFDRYGQVTEVFLKHDATMPGRLWALITYADSSQATLAVALTHQQLRLPGATRACDVNFARNASPRQ